MASLPERKDAHVLEQGASLLGETFQPEKKMVMEAIYQWMMNG